VGENPGAPADLEADGRVGVDALLDGGVETRHGLGAGRVEEVRLTGLWVKDVIFSKMEGHAECFSRHFFSFFLGTKKKNWRSTA